MNMIASPTNPLETASAYGLFPAGDFVVTTGGRAGRMKYRDFATVPTIPQALWFFRSEVIAVPRAGVSVAGFDPLKLSLDDVLAWNATMPAGSARDLPGLVWLGAPDVVRNARIVADDDGGERLLTPDGPAELALAPRLASNRAFYNADSAAFFGRRVVHLRGEWTAGRTLEKRFVVHGLWPEGYRLDSAAPLQALAPTARALREFVREAPQGGAQSPFVTRLVWQRDAAAASRRAGRPVIALMLSWAYEGYVWTVPGGIGLVLTILGNVILFGKRRP